MKNKKILFFVSEDWYFKSHRLNLALDVKKKGAQIFLITKINTLSDDLKNNGIKVTPVDIERSNLNIFLDIKLLFQLYKIVKKIEPDTMHNISLKPVLLGTIIGSFTGVKNIVNTLPGLGYLKNESKNFFDFILKKIIIIFIKFCLKSFKSKLVLQNKSDLKNSKKLFKSKKNQLFLIAGSGVDCNYYYPKIKKKNNFKITLISRMIWDKGIKEFVNSAKEVKKIFPQVEFILVGKTDNKNKNHIPLKYLNQLNHDGIVKWIGYLEDVREVLDLTDIACLPTFYGEGLPKFLLEANALSVPIICSNNPGCVELVKNNYNGLVVPEKNVKKLVDAMIFLISNSKQRLQMGKNGRKLVLEKFESKYINSKYIQLY